MPEYLAPGVYVEEVEMGPKPIEGVSTSTLGILGETKRGPLKPKLVTSFSEFNRIYGGYMENSNMAYAVEGFFNNGGQRAYVARIFNGDPKTHLANNYLKKGNPVEPSPKLKINALGPGEWGNKIYYNIVKASLNTEVEGKKKNPELFKLIVAYYEKPTDKVVAAEPNKDKLSIKEPKDLTPEPTILEVYDNLSPKGISSDYCEKRINGTSQLIEVDLDGMIDIGVMKEEKAEYLPLVGGGEIAGKATVDKYKGENPPPKEGEETGLLAFENVDDISIVLAPDDYAVNTLQDAIVTHCEKMKDRFAILQAQQNAGGEETLWPPADSQYAAFYYPWIYVYDSLKNKQKLVPPGGHMAGIYARTDVERGVHKAPANEVVRGVSEIQFPISKPVQDVLNPRGVNCIRFFQGRGIRIWGARTCSSDPLWKYINVRRLFLFMEESIDQGTQWVVFEPNNEALWARVEQTIYNFLYGVWRTGALMGVTPDQGFFVKCGRTTMTQDDIDNGRLVCEIGVAPTKPAEFVIFRIAQWTAGAA